MAAEEPDPYLRGMTAEERETGFPVDNGTWVNWTDNPGVPPWLIQTDN